MIFHKYILPKPDPADQYEVDLINSLNDMILDLDAIFNQQATFADYDIRYLKLDGSNSMSDTDMIANLNADMVDGKHASEFFTEAEGDLRWLGILSTAANADKWDNYHFADYLDQAVKTTSSPQFARVYLDNASTYLDKDDDGNLILVDAVTGSRTLKELGCPTMVKLVATGLSAGNHNLTYAGWGVSKAQIMLIKVVSATCTDFNVEIFEKDTFLEADRIFIAENVELQLNSLIGVLIYQDQDSTDELHISITNNAGGSPEFAVETRGIELL